MLYTLMKAAHLLAVILWLGGMFFALYCLRPAAASLDGPLRVRVMQDALARFFGVVKIAIVVIVVSSVSMLYTQWGAARRTGLGFNMPLDWWAMAVLGVVMIGIFGYIRGVLARRLAQAVAAGNWPAGGAALGRIRSAVTVNLGIGTAIVIVTRLGQTA